MTIDQFIERLEGVQASAGGYVALCPAHDDSNASLSIHEGQTGVVVRCHAGCSFPDICAALGIEQRDMFFESGNQSEPEAIYRYRDERGTELFQTVRFPGKRIKQRHMGDDGEWVWNLKNVRRVLYRLPEIIEAVERGNTVFFVEGEKDADAIVAAGYQATCNPLGAGKWRDEYAPFFQGANVVIVADRDEAGRNHANKVKEALVGIAAGVWVVQAKVGKDAHDHLSAGLPIEEMVPLKDRLRRGVFSGPDVADSAIEYLEVGESDLPAYEPLSIGLAFRPGRLYTVGGYTGDGKSALALQITRGLCTTGASVAFFSLEMGLQDIQNRLLSHLGIPMSKLERPWEIKASIALENLYRAGVEEIRQWPLSIIVNPSLTSEQIREEVIHGEPDFVIVDHIHRFRWGRERRDLEEQIQVLTNLSLDYNIPVMVLAQLRRYQNGAGFEKFPRPTAQDFKETGALEQESAMQIAVWRQRDEAGLRYDPSGHTQLLVLKDRHGPLREYMLKFDGERQVFDSVRPVPLIVPQSEPEGVAVAWHPTS